MSDDSTPDLTRRRVLQMTGAAAGTAALAGVTQATPGRKPGPNKDEVLVGVSAGAGDLEATVDEHVPSTAECSGRAISFESSRGSTPFRETPWTGPPYGGPPSWRSAAPVRRASASNRATGSP